MGFKRSACTFIIPAPKLDEFRELLTEYLDDQSGRPILPLEWKAIHRNAVEVRIEPMLYGGSQFAIGRLVDARIPFFLCYDGCDGEYESGWSCWATHMDAVVHLGGCLQPHVKQMPDCTFKITYQTLVKATLHNSELNIDTDPGDRSGTLLRRLNSLNSVLNTIEETK